MGKQTAGPRAQGWHKTEDWGPGHLPDHSLDTEGPQAGEGDGAMKGEGRPGQRGRHAFSPPGALAESPLAFPFSSCASCISTLLVCVQE